MEEKKNESSVQTVQNITTYAQPFGYELTVCGKLNAKGKVQLEVQVKTYDRMANNSGITERIASERDWAVGHIKKVMEELK